MALVLGLQLLLSCSGAGISEAALLQARTLNPLFAHSLCVSLHCVLFHHIGVLCYSVSLHYRVCSSNQCVRSPNRIPSPKCCWSAVCTVTQRTTSYKAQSKSGLMHGWRVATRSIDRCRTNLRKPQGSELLLTVPQSCQQYSTPAFPQKQMFESMIVFARGQDAQTIGYSSTCHQSLQIRKLKLENLN